MPVATMRAAVYDGPGQLTVRELPVPAVGPRDVLLAVSHCGICGTDLHMTLEGWARPGDVGGHEFAGRVHEVGAEVAGWSAGDLVVADGRVCGQCPPCLAGRPSLCHADPLRAGGEHGPGAFAEYHRVHASQLHRVPAGVPARAAALTEPLAVAVHALTRAGVVAGAPATTRALVTGAGPIGLFAVAALRAMGLTDVTVSEPSPGRRERALRAGAKDAVAPADLPAAPASPTRTATSPYDVVLECSGHASAATAGLGLLAPGGTLVFVGTGRDRPDLDPLRILLNELVVTGAYNYDAGGFPAALALLGSGALPVDALTEPDDVPLAGLLAAMRDLAAGRRAGKVLVAPGADGTPGGMRA